MRRSSQELLSGIHEASAKQGAWGQSAERAECGLQAVLQQQNAVRAECTCTGAEHKHLSLMPPPQEAWTTATSHIHTTARVPLLQVRALEVGTARLGFFFLWFRAIFSGGIVVRAPFMFSERYHIADRYMTQTIR